MCALCHIFLNTPPHRKGVPMHYQSMICKILSHKCFGQNGDKHIIKQSNCNAVYVKGELFEILLLRLTEEYQKLCQLLHAKGGIRVMRDRLWIFCGDYTFRVFDLHPRERV